MKLFPAAAAAALALAASTSAFAADPLLDVLLDFETVTGYTPIAEFYNGGTDGAGATGTNYGVSFGGSAFGLVNDGLGNGPNGEYFTNAPSPVGVLTFVDGGAATLNAAAGFAYGISFAYSSAAAVTDAVQVWSGLNGTGTLLATIDLSANAQADGCSSSDICHFDSITTTFGGVAHSVTFGNAANAAAFDNLHIGAVPEPTTIVMMVLGVAGLAAARRRA